MSNRRYRTKPGMPRTETDAMVRALAIEMLDGSLAELEQEIAVLQITVDLYFAEARERKKNPTKDHGRWQVSPGVGLRAVAMLRKLREKRDEMLSAAEKEILEQALSEGAKQKVENAKQPAGRPHAEASAKAGETGQGQDKRADTPQPATQESLGKQANTPERSRDPATTAA